ncbi:MULTISPECIES: hypothetical protein [unclassified Methylobacterium]|uniref:hypothetical protein n=1 Tax=unclassified Methylobacterium TaxID=2615210 RepID=UPI0005BC0734|nr:MULTISPECIES: hypothetical protein [unclassified Methylobacterium]
MTERQARIRLGHAVAAAGGQVAFARAVGLPVAARSNNSALSKSLRGTQRISPPILDAIGLRRDECGDIHTVEPARISVLAVHAEGDAGVRAAAALVAGIHGPRP